MVQAQLANEWQLLQNQCDSYEKHSLYIKLVTITLFCLAYWLNRCDAILLIITLILWGQDAIWKTVQARIEQRLLALEMELISVNDSVVTTAYSYHLNYRKSRPSTVGLIKEYARQALRPTVTFPYFILVIIIGVFALV
ncbi:MAG: hypothetical protein HRU23_05525 [Gammaproteobacteria bacterium]|nr:hypothetical protein [Gammaproteobacteria bacterium]